MTFTEAIARFEARRNGAGWFAKCPSHEDRQPSLSLSKGADGRTLLKCHAGCTLDAILAAKGMQPRDLFATSGTVTTTSKPQIVEVYPYLAEDYTELYEVVRYEPKAFKQRRRTGPDSYAWSIGDVRRVLFQLPELKGKTDVYIVEGEKDCYKLRQIGLSATTGAGGASKDPKKSKWRPEYIEQLKQAGAVNVYVIPDNDEPGRAHAQAVAESCHAAGLTVRIVELPGLPPKGDVSDFLKANHHDKAHLVTLATNAPIFGTVSSPPEIPASGESTDDPIDEVVSRVLGLLSRYVVMSSAQHTAVALWVLHTHAFAAADCTPYLAITSATKRSGKTRLLEVLVALVRAAWLTGRVSPAALVRKIDAHQPTLLLDESDTAFKHEGEYSEVLRSVLNSGYRRSGTSSLCVKAKDGIEFKDFKTFAPKAIAGIGKLPDTVMDRAIPVRLERRRSSEAVARLRERELYDESGPIRHALTAWAAQSSTIATLRESRPDVPETLGDRAADVWEPLLAIADLLGGEWPVMAREAAVMLSGEQVSDDDDIVLVLLRDINTLLDQDAGTGDDIASKQIHDGLVALEDRPWATWSQGRPITRHKVGRLLADFGIRSTDVRIDGKVVKAYRREALKTAVERYLAFEAQQRNNANNDGPKPAISKAQQPELCSAFKSEISSMNTESSCAVALQTSETREDQHDVDGYRF